MLRDEDKALLEEKGISEQQVEQQLKRFATGFPYLKIKDVARTGQGITVLTPEEESTYSGTVEEISVGRRRGVQVCAGFRSSLAHVQGSF